MASPLLLLRAARRARRLYPIAAMAYERWKALPDEEKERYKQRARDAAQRAGERGREAAGRGRRLVDERRGRGGGASR